MKLTHPAVVAFGLAMLPMLPVVAPLIEPSHSLIYHFDGPPSAVFYPVMIGIGLLWILLTGPSCSRADPAERDAFSGQRSYSCCPGSC